jgi:hypothetical protein
MNMKAGTTRYDTTLPAQWNATSPSPERDQAATRLVEQTLLHQPRVHVLLYLPVMPSKVVPANTNSILNLS